MGLAEIAAMPPPRAEAYAMFELRIRTSLLPEAAMLLARYSAAFPELLAVRTALAKGGRHAAQEALRLAMKEDPHGV